MVITSTGAVNGYVGLPVKTAVAFKFSIVGKEENE
jgi:hypothetical protein